MKYKTGQMKLYKGIPIFIPNDSFDLEDTGCYVSYNNYDIHIYGCDTTALVRMDGINPTKFLILNGNHLKEYFELKTYDKCVRYFTQHLEQQNKLSENWDEEMIIDDKGNISVQKCI